jgi:hypothetical protein
MGRGRSCTVLTTAALCLAACGSGNSATAQDMSSGPEPHAAVARVLASLGDPSVQGVDVIPAPGVYGWGSPCLRVRVDDSADHGVKEAWLGRLVEGAVGELVRTKSQKTLGIRLSSRSHLAALGRPVDRSAPPLQGAAPGRQARRVPQHIRGCRLSVGVPGPCRPHRGAQTRWAGVPPGDPRPTMSELEAGGCFVAARSERRRWEVELTTEQVTALFRTFSNWTGEEVDDVAAAADACGGRVTEHYQSVLHLLRRAESTRATSAHA